MRLLTLPAPHPRCPYPHDSLFHLSITYACNPAAIPLPLQGFYLYPTVPKGQKAPKDKQINPAASELVAKHSAGAAAEAGLKEASDDVLVERMVLRFVKECMHSLEDGIIKSPGDGDIGAVFGLGFPVSH